MFTLFIIIIIINVILGEVAEENIWTEEGRGGRR
jgi:hypothetical protein